MAFVKIPGKGLLSRIFRNCADPKLTITQAPFESIKDKADVDTCFIYAPRTMKLAEVYAVRKLLPKSIANWYVFGE